MQNHYHYQYRQRNGRARSRKLARLAGGVRTVGTAPSTSTSPTIFQGALNLNLNMFSKTAYVCRSDTDSAGSMNIVASATSEVSNVANVANVVTASASAVSAAAVRGESSSALSTSLTQLGAGAIAGLVNTLVLSPLDVVKTRLQVQGGARKYNGTMHALRTMLRQEGIGSYYKGLSAALWAFVPNWAVWWCAYEYFKKSYSVIRDTRVPNCPLTFVHISAAVSAGSITALTTSPLWVLKARLQTEIALGNARSYKSVPHGLARIFREEGLAGLYKGLAPSLLGLGHVAVQFPLYEYVKKLQLGIVAENDKTSAEVELRAKHVLIASSLSKIVASSLFYPHEVLRTKLQIDRSVGGEYGKVYKLAQNIMKSQGYRGFYNGFGANLIRTVPSCCLTFTAYEFAKRFVEKRTRKAKRNQEEGGDVGIA